MRSATVRRFPVLLAASALLVAGCAAPAVVFLNPRYLSSGIQRVAVLDFGDFPGMAGSGKMASQVFGNYLVAESYSVVDPAQVSLAMQQMGLRPGAGMDPAALRALASRLGVDAVVQGQVTDFTDAGTQSVVEDVTLEQDTPVYNSVAVTHQLPNGATVSSQENYQSGMGVGYVQQPVQTTQATPAHVGLSVRMVDVHNGEVLWSATDSEYGSHLNDAMQSASSQIVQGLQDRIRSLTD